MPKVKVKPKLKLKGGDRPSRIPVPSPPTTRAKASHDSAMTHPPKESMKDTPDSPDRAESNKDGFMTVGCPKPIPPKRITPPTSRASSVASSHRSSTSCSSSSSTRTNATSQSGRRSPPPTSPTTSTQRAQPQPIILHQGRKNPTHSTLLAVLRQNGLEKHVARIGLRKDGMAIFARSAHSQAELAILFKENQYDYHVTRSKAERPLRFVVKGLPPDTDMQFMADELIRKKMEVVTIKRMARGAGKSRVPLPMFLVELANNESSKAILSLTNLLFLRVRVEPDRGSSSVLQCHNCQKFGHVKATCCAVQRCVKCGNPHDTRDCPVNDDTAIVCANCAGNHTASYRGCPLFVEAAKQFSLHNPRRQTENTRQNRPRTQPPTEWEYHPSDFPPSPSYLERARMPPQHRGTKDQRQKRVQQRQAAPIPQPAQPPLAQRRPAR